MGIVFSLFCCDLFLFFVLFPGIIIIISSFKKEKEKGKGFATRRFASTWIWRRLSCRKVMKSKVVLMGIGFLGARYCTLVFRVDCGCLCEM
jgi:ABC-type spermidine/putrescine transport system permease subunit II